MSAWPIYTAGRHDHTVSGDVRHIRNVKSPQLGNTRDLLIYLPPSYLISNKHYPVLYMQDGQNLFDAQTSFAGEWHVDESMERLGAEEGIESIVVGIPNNSARIHEYNPYPGQNHRFGEARGDSYVRFLIETIMPMINRDFRTHADPAHTGILGSSMGGLISLYAYLTYPDVFGLCAAMSPSLWLAMGAVFDHATRSSNRNGRLYLDVGGHEMKNRRHSSAIGDSVSDLRDHLTHVGFPANKISFVRDPHGEHNEASWARRFPDAVRFLLSE